jgi:hypothetical protein
MISKNIFLNIINKRNIIIFIGGIIFLIINLFQSRTQEQERFGESKKCDPLDPDENKCDKGYKCVVNEDDDNFEGECEKIPCKEPTNANPMMNWMPFDDYNKPSQCLDSKEKYNDTIIKKYQNIPLSNTVSNTLIKKVYTNPVLGYVNDLEGYKNGLTKIKGRFFKTYYKLDDVYVNEVDNKYVTDFAKESKLNYNKLFK